MIESKGINIIDDLYLLKTVTVYLKFKRKQQINKDLSQDQ